MTLDRLQRELRSCRLCEDKGILPEARPVFQLSTTAKVAVFGQAPGNLAHQHQKPFLDPSGDRLREWMGVKEDLFYDASRLAIVPMAFCFPGYDGKSKTGKGGDLPPPSLCADTWREVLMQKLSKQIKLVLLVGQYAQAWHLADRKKRTLTDTVQNWRDYLDNRKNLYGFRYLPLPHPSWRNNAWLKKNLWFEEEVLPFLRSEIQQLLGDTT